MGIENLSVEQPPKPALKTKEINLIEMDLIKRSGMSAERWIKKNAKSFRVIVEDPALSQTFLEIYSQNPEAIEDFIERALIKRKQKKAASPLVNDNYEWN